MWDKKINQTEIEPRKRNRTEKIPTKKLKQTSLNK